MQSYDTKQKGEGADYDNSASGLELRSQCTGGQKAFTGKAVDYDIQGLSQLFTDRCAHAPVVARP